MKRKSIRRMVLVGLVVALGLVFGAAPEASSTVNTGGSHVNSDACVPLPLPRPLDGLTCNQEQPAAT